jgi:hypothetical protein
MVFRKMMILLNRKVSCVDLLDCKIQFLQEFNICIKRLRRTHAAELRGMQGAAA